MKNLAHYFRQAQKEHETIAAVSKSMIGLMKSIYDDYAGKQSAQQTAKDPTSQKEPIQTKH